MDLQSSSLACLWLPLCDAYHGFPPDARGDSRSGESRARHSPALALPFPGVHPGGEDFRIFQPYQHPLCHLFLFRFLFG